MYIIKKKEERLNKAATVLQDKGSTVFLDGEYGVCVDIGTTTVAVSLYNLYTGECCGSKEEENAQTTYGKDVMMRIMHCLQGKEEILKELLVKQIEKIIESLTKNICTKDCVKHMTVVGNTAMCHIFLGEDVVGLAGAPFKGSYEGAWSGNGMDLGFELFKDISIYILPGIGGHVGADAAAVVFSEEMTDENRVELAIDLGTNAEIILNNHGKICACSAAAGPAFEGKGISCGTRAKPGAVAGVKMAVNTSNIILDALGVDSGEKLTGICGSGLIDAIAWMHKLGIMEDSGYLIDRENAKEKGLPYFFEKCIIEDEDRKFMLYSDYKNQIWISQEDIRNFQLAKAAVAAGVETLCEKEGISLGEIDRVIVAGMFGTFLHPEHAVNLGLFSNIVKDKLDFVGNAAGRGALKALFFPEFRSKVEKDVKKIQHIELALEPAFQKLFIENLSFR